MHKSSRIPGFYNQRIEERRAYLRAFLEDKDQDLLARLTGPGLTPEQADQMIENVIGVFSLPLGVATNFLVNGRDVIVPMVIEEPSVVAGASNVAKLVRAGGGFTAAADEARMIAQLQVLDVPDLEKAQGAVQQHKAEAIRLANEVNPQMLALGGGARDIEVRALPHTAAGPMLVVHLIYDTQDAMGANTINTAAERLANWVEAVTGGKVHLRILSNLADQRLARAHCVIPCESLAFEGFSGEQVRDGIIQAWAFAEADPYRAATHNKGIMNGIDAVLLATGNDWRAVEAGAHAYAARGGRYTSLSTWRVGDKGGLEGSLELPMAVGTVGGATHVHPVAELSRKLLRVNGARELAETLAAVGLAQNLAALRALATEGIQRGHMRLHARQMAIAAGAQGNQVAQIAEQMVLEGDVRLERAQELMDAAGS